MARNSRPVNFNPFSVEVMISIFKFFVVLALKISKSEQKF